MDRRYSWFAVLGMVMLSVAVGMVAYNAGFHMDSRPIDSRRRTAGSRALRMASSLGILAVWAIPVRVLLVFVLRLFFWRAASRGPRHYRSGPFDPHRVSTSGTAALTNG